jgi:hypothetical protein
MKGKKGHNFKNKETFTNFGDSECLETKFSPKTSIEGDIKKK